MEVPLIWKLRVDGSNEIKSTMANLNTAFERGQINNEEYADSLQKMAREGQKYNNVGRYQNQIYLSMHPNIRKVTQGLSLFASVGRTALSIMTAYNTLLTASNTKSSALAEEEVKLAEAMRTLARSVPGSAEWQTAQEQISIINARIKELKDQEFNQHLQTWLQPLFDVGIIAGLFKNHLSKIVGYLPGLSALINPFTAIGVGAALAGKAIADWLVNLLGIEEWRANNGKMLEEFFLVSIPTAIGQAGVFLTNFFLNDLPKWAADGWKAVSDIFVKTWNAIIGFLESGINFMIDGFVGFVNMIIDGINRIIDGLNKLPGVSIGKIGHFSLDHVKLGRIETEETNNKKTSTQQGPSNTYITVQGSVITERELLNKVDKSLKSDLKNSGFK